MASCARVQPHATGTCTCICGTCTLTDCLQATEQSVGQVTAGMNTGSADQTSIRTKAMLNKAGWHHAVCFDAWASRLCFVRSLYERSWLGDNQGLDKTYILPKLQATKANARKPMVCKDPWQMCSTGTSKTAKHLEVLHLCMQQLVKNTTITVRKVRSEDSPAEILTKLVTSESRELACEASTTSLTQFAQYVKHQLHSTLYDLLLNQPAYTFRVGTLMDRPLQVYNMSQSWTFETFHA